MTELASFMQSQSELVEDLHREQIRELTQKVVSGLSTGCTDFKICFEGITAKVNEDNECEISVGKRTFEAWPEETKMQELQKEITKLETEVAAFKMNCKELIALAGDVDQEMLDSLMEITDLSVRSKWKGASPVDLDSKLACFEDLARTNSLHIHLDASGVNSTTGGFALHMSQPSDEEINLRVKLAFQSHLLQLYNYLYFTHQEGNITQQFSRKFSLLGIPMVIISTEATVQGFHKEENGIVVIEQMKVSYADGCEFEGRSEDGYKMGKGSFRLINGAKFEGQIVDKNTAEGTISLCGVINKGKFRITDTGNYSLIGPGCEIYENGKLVKQGDFQENGEFEGWRAIEDGKVTGHWDSCGQLTRGRIEFATGRVVEGQFVVSPKLSKKTVSN